MLENILIEVDYRSEIDLNLCRGNNLYRKILMVRLFNQTPQLFNGILYTEVFILLTFR